eukprot:CAMPEP_0118811010 /NCGR_PEP_ID=MMETSP1162-20130426/1372_1 /TAXON_ID=33656 /ORGANISM="Phaeocystis Sp, Strain CCMP2710" /LENGTH=260 /DNA_ID=CAMNT_0006740609 /DNA_START=168 /DNA_END=947 /DNA_ORIENTATION=+
MSKLNIAPKLGPPPTPKRSIKAASCILADPSPLASGGRATPGRRRANRASAAEDSILALDRAVHYNAVADAISALDSDDQRDDQAVQTERGAKAPDEHHADVQLGLAGGVLHAAQAAHANRKARRQVAQPHGQARAQVRIPRVERVGCLRALARRGHAARDDHGDDEAEDAAHAGKDDGHDRLHDELRLHLVARQLRDRREAERGLPRAVSSAHVPKDERERGAEEAEERRVLGAVRAHDNLRHGCRSRAGQGGANTAAP